MALSDIHSKDLLIDDFEKVRKSEMARVLEDEKNALATQPLKNITIPSPIFNYEGKMQSFPSAGIRFFGCLKCEWKSTSMCPYGFISGKGSSLKENTHANGICEERRNYLKGFYRGDKARPSFTEWLFDYNQGLAQTMMNDDFNRLKEFDKSLSEFESTHDMISLMAVDPEVGDPEVAYYRSLKGARDSARFEWMRLWQELMKFDDKRIDRETPKKAEVTHTVIKPSDVSEMLKRANAEIIDVSPDDYNMVDTEDVGGEELSDLGVTGGGEYNGDNDGDESHP